MAAPYGGRALNMEYRQAGPTGMPALGMQPTSIAAAPYMQPGANTLVYGNVPMPMEGQMQVYPGTGANLNPMISAVDHYPTSDGFASPYESLPAHINRNPFFKSYYDLPADLRTASNPPGDYVVLESQPELRYMLTGPPAQEPTLQPEYGKPLSFQKCRLKLLQIRSDDPNDEEGPAVQLSEVLLFDEFDQVIDTGLAVASCTSVGASEDGQEAGRVLDGNPYSKFLRTVADLPVDLELDLGIRCRVKAYAWRTADDMPARDPISWIFQIFTKHGWATLDQVTLHYVPMKRHTLVGPFRLGSPYDPTVHPDYQDQQERPPPPRQAGPMPPMPAPPPQGHATAPPVVLQGYTAERAIDQSTYELNELIHSTFPRQEGWNAYHALVETLLEAQADPNYCDMQGRSSLLKACAEGDGYVIHRLVQCGADVNAQQATIGEAPLHRLVLVGDHRNLKIVLDAGADTNVQDTEGDTPLHLATAKMDLAGIKLLLKHHARRDLANRKGQIPIDVWEEQMRVGVARSSPDAGAVRTILLGAVRPPVEW